MTQEQTRAPRPGWFAPTFHGYHRAWVRTDVLAGVTAGAVVVPQAMAYATIANLPVEIGLYTCMLPMLVYAFLGGSRAMSVSTTSTIATLTATALVTAGVASSTKDSESELIALTLMVGVILVAARILKLGSLVENINEATLIGLKVGLGATVALGQVPKMLGVDVQVTGHGFIRTLNATIEAVPKANVPTLILSIGSIAVLVVLRRFAPRIPGQLIVVAGGILLGAFAGISSLGVDLIPKVPQGLPAPDLPPLDKLTTLIPAALAIAIMAFLETASVARGIRQSGEPPIDSNRELLAVGAASIAGSFFYSLPAAGGFSQSAVNQRAGARSQLSAIVTAALAVLVALFLGPVLDNLPQASLAAMVFIAVLGLIDIRGMVRLFRISRLEFWIAIVTAAIGLAAGLLAAVAAGVVFTLGAVLRELNKPRIETMVNGSVLHVRLLTSLYTANVRPTQDAIERVIDETPNLRILVLDGSAVIGTSVTVLDSLAEFDRELSSRDIRLEVMSLTGPPLEMAQKTAWWRQLAAEGRIGE
jgi:SulP family sulfate permease